MDDDFRVRNALLGSDLELPEVYLKFELSKCALQLLG